MGARNLVNTIIWLLIGTGNGLVWAWWFSLLG